MSARKRGRIYFPWETNPPIIHQVVIDEVPALLGKWERLFPP